jgi:2-C-methyl-D-erythritol 4-phosphate cytidylyltransferase
MYLLIPAAGLGRRMGGARRRTNCSYNCDRSPLITWTLLAAQAAHSIDWLGIIAQPIRLVRLEGNFSGTIPH